MKPIEITDDNFESEVMKSDLPVLIDFWAAWCGPCRMIAPIVEELAGEYNGKVKIGKLDVDNNQQTAIKYGVRSIPTLLVFKNGEVKDTIIGAVPKSQISQKLDAVA
ncbi:MAG: thioredoxin [Ignavibacteriales bacterium CG12_big_fil_rev_8_21_14_0_65_30_8]|nr:MAG: thioredoxin [Ignavibacteriales bacterium CG12_big_fil_rev_8_21_14_0_65_30_8]